MSHASRWRLIAELVGIIFITLSTGCTSSISTTAPTIFSPSVSTQSNGASTFVPSEQDIYAAVLNKDRQSLDRGILSYSRIENMKTATTTQFEVTVTDVGKGPQLARVSEYNGMNVYQQDIPTHGIVGIQIITCDNLTCHSESNIRQPVLYKGQQAEWFWQIIAGTPGSVAITLRADTYDQGSTQPLAEEIINVNFNVASTPNFNKQQNHKRIVTAANNAYGDIEKIGTIAGAITAVAAVVSLILAMRKRKARPGDEQQSEEARSGS